MKQNLFLVIIAIVTFGLTKSTANAKLIGYWKFDGITLDSSGYGNHGLEYGQLMYAKGVEGLAIDLDGSGDYIKIPNESHFDLTEALTLAAWIKVDKFTAENHTLISKGPRDWHIRSVVSSDLLDWYCNDTNPNERITSRTSVADGKWHHVAGIYDGSEMRLYIDGVLDVSAENSGLVDESDYPVLIGAAPVAIEGSDWKGMIDEVAIFDHPLTAEEVSLLHKKSPEEFLKPKLAEIIRATRHAGDMLENEGPEETIKFLEEIIAKARKDNQNSNSHGLSILQTVMPDLQLQLTRATEAANQPKQQIMDGYRKGLLSNRLGISNTVSTSLKLFTALAADDYVDLISSVLQKNGFYLNALAAQADKLIKLHKPQQVAAFLEANLSGYRKYRQENSFNDSSAEHCVSEIYFQLARAYLAADSNDQQIAYAYKGTFTYSSREYIDQRTRALEWLIENDRDTECAEIANGLRNCGSVGRESFKKVIRNLSLKYERENNFINLRILIDILVVHSDDPHIWVGFIGTCFLNKNNKWANQYFEYVNKNPRLRFIAEKRTAQEYMAARSYEKAAQIYNNILEKCRPDDDKTFYEFSFCKCLYEGGHFRQAATALNKFVENRKKNCRIEMIQAMSMSGYSNVQLGKFDQALDNYFTLMIEYPESANMPEIMFFVGYCYMLQGKYEPATEAFNCLIKAHPDSKYCDMANQCVKRMLHMTD